MYTCICAIIINNAGMFELPSSLNREVEEFFFFLSFFLQFSEYMSPFFYFVDQGFRNAWEFKHRSTMQDSEQVPSGLDQRASWAAPEQACQLQCHSLPRFGYGRNRKLAILLNTATLACDHGTLRSDSHTTSLPQTTSLHPSHIPSFPLTPHRISTGCRFSENAVEEIHKQLSLGNTRPSPGFLGDCRDIESQ